MVAGDIRSVLLQEELLHHRYSGFHRIITYATAVVVLITQPPQLHFSVGDCAQRPFFICQGGSLGPHWHVHGQSVRGQIHHCVALLGLDSVAPNHRALPSGIQLSSFSPASAEVGGQTLFEIQPNIQISSALQAYEPSWCCEAQTDMAHSCS